LAVDEVRAAVQAGFAEQGDGQVQLAPRTTTDSASGLGWLRLMPVILNGSKLMGYKAMHSTPGVGVRYVVMLYDLATGELLAAIDADWLTLQRTSATAAIGVDLLANPQIASVGLLGSSEQARAILSAVSRVRTLPRVKVFSPTLENRRRFAETMSRALDLDVVPVDSAQDAVTGSDLVLSMFRAGRTPIIDAGWIAPGAHISAASSVRPDARELMDEVWRCCTVVSVDDKTHAFESGDGVSALSSGSVMVDQVAGIWEILNGSRLGRSSARDVTLFKSVGTGLEDLALAAAVYRRAGERGIGQDLGAFPRARK
jgi:ornithine cyclodeaminase/alanine dehydrogenase